MSNYPDALENLIEMLRRLPSIGRRGATRIALALLKDSPGRLAELGGAISNLKNAVTFCPDCGALASKHKLCDICRSPRRDRTTICVVEEATEILPIEDSGAYSGLYHVLGGRLSPLDDATGGSLNTEKLLARLQSGEVKEVILALGSDVESRATAVYLSDLLKGRDIRITQLAQGLPSGATVAYADGATIGAALRGRIGVDNG